MKGQGEFIDGDITETKYTARTIDELRSRLKHIAGLCYGLSIDLANDLERLALLEKENAELRNKLCLYDRRAAERAEKLSKLSPEEREKREEQLLKRRLQVAESRKKKVNKGE